MVHPLVVFLFINYLTKIVIIIKMIKHTTVNSEHTLDAIALSSSVLASVGAKKLDGNVQNSKIAHLVSTSVGTRNKAA